MLEAYNPAMRIGIAQINPRVGAVKQNVEEVLSRIAEAKQAECDLVIFPELALCGCPLFEVVRRAGFVDRVEMALQAVIDASNGIGVIVGGVSLPKAKPTVAGTGHKLLDSAFVISSGS